MRSTARIDHRRASGPTAETARPPRAAAAALALAALLGMLPLADEPRSADAQPASESGSSDAPRRFEAHADYRDVPREAHRDVPREAPLSQPRETFAAAREEFIEAWENVGADEAVPLAEDSERLRAYPLYPYLEAARIAAALGRAEGRETEADGAARSFIARHGEEPVSRVLRRARLDSLARREQWRSFLAEASLSDDDSAVRCTALRARIAIGDIEGIAPDIVDVWLTDRQLSLDCEPVFEWLRAEGLMTDDLVEQRVRLLLESGQAAFARIIARRLPQERAAPLERWADLLEQPAAALDRLLDAPDTALPDGALEAGWSRLTRDRPMEALERFDALVDAFGLDRAARSRAALALALGLAWDRRPQALDFFARVAADDLDDYALGWLARAALWAGDWRLAEDAITAMTPGARDETRWRYWAARAAERTGDRRRARDLYRSILPRDNYYAAMASARLGTPAEPGQRSIPRDETRVERIAAMPAFVRARELFFSRLPWLAAVEWHHGSAALADDDGPQTIHVAMSWGWYDLGVATATSHRIFDDYRLLYPRPYETEVTAASELTGIDPALIHAVIRQESLYRRDAASGAGALGLVQLKPETARRAARRWGLPEPTRADLLVPSTNVTLGAAELASLLDEFRDQLPVALAGYNAGPNAARRWLPERALESDVWIENIPYNETRGYVQRVLWHSLVFEWLGSGEARDTRSWLAHVGPPADEHELRAQNRVER